MNLKNKIAETNHSISGMLYLKKFETIDGLSGTKIAFRNSGLGINEKRTMLLKSLNKRNIIMPKTRVNNDSKPYNVLILFIRLPINYH
ncbi:MAG: hypothetical protein LBB89_08005 [Treponema sp.]|nr:hypothetical protein [Treponema sp.]